MSSKPTYQELEKRIKSLELDASLRNQEDGLNAQARKNYARFLKFLPVPVLVQRADGFISYLNPAFTSTFGWTLPELQEDGDQYIPPDIRNELENKINALDKNRAVLHMDSKRLAKDGSLLDVIMRIGIEKDEANQPTEMIIVVRDVTMEKRISRIRSAMNRISQALPKYPQLKKRLNYVSAEIKELLGTESANVILLDTEEEQFYIVSSAHDDPGTRKRIEKVRFAVDEIISGWVLKTGEPLIVNDFSDFPERFGHRDQKVGYKIKNVILAPLRTKERIIGVLSADNKKHGKFDKTDLEILNNIAGTVALSIENARVSNELIETLEEVKSLNQAKDKMISHLSHELKTPVAILMTSFKILTRKMDALPEETWKPTFERIKRNLDRIIGIEDEVFDIVEHKQFLHKQVFSLVLDQCADKLEALIAMETGEKGVIQKVRKKIDAFFLFQDQEPESIRLNLFVKDRIKELKPLYKHRNVNISTRLASSPPVFIPTDPLTKVVDGLIRNAVENTPDEGKIEIRVIKEQSGVRLDVKDYGVGITQDAQKRIFEGFFMTQETLAYSSKRPFDFNAGGKGADLLRMKIFSEKFNFKIHLTSKRCSRIPEHDDNCPGQKSLCEKGLSKTSAGCDGFSTFSVLFPFGEIDK